MSVATTAAASHRAAVPRYRPYVAQVVRTKRLGPHFVRVTFTGADMASFGYVGYDQRIKVVLPRAGATVHELPTGEDCYLRWRQMPEDLRPAVRTYTVRAFRPEAAELDVDFVLHGPGRCARGVLSTWAGRARPGDEIALLGPDRPGTGRPWGVEWAPPSTTRYTLIAGDETAVPAMGAILDSKPPRLHGVVLAEVPTRADILPWSAHPRVDVRWLVRERPEGEVPRGTLLESAVRDTLSQWCGGSPTAPTDVGREDDADDTVLWDVPEQHLGGSDEPYVWLAGEAGVMKRLRRLARDECGLAKSALACMGYWRQGATESL
jgi:NADPH-dependent ferric siderophore reductase